MFVSNIVESQLWYEKLLGYPPRYIDEKFALFEVGKTNLCFHLADEKTPLTTGGSVTYWWVEDFDKALSKIKALGGLIYRGPIPTEAGLRICQIKDPYGNVFGLEGPSV